MITDRAWLRRAGNLADRERYALKLAARCGVAVPKCLLTGWLPRSQLPVIVMERVDGEALETRLGRAGAALSMTVDTLVSLHTSVNRDGAGSEARHIPCL